MNLSHNLKIYVSSYIVRYILKYENLICLQENFYRGLLIGCILVATVHCNAEDEARQRETSASPKSVNYEDDVVGAEDHE